MQKLAPLLAVFLTAACLGSADADPPPEVTPPDCAKPKIKDQHFCCQAIDTMSFSGDDCVTIGETQIDLCNKVLYCPGKWAKDDGRVICD